MTTARKVVLIVATVLLLGGAALSMGAFAMADFRFENLSNTTRDWTSNTSTMNAEAEAPHTAIVVRDRGEGVRFEPTDGDAIEVTYWTGTEKSMTITDEGGVLEIDGTGSPLAGVMIMKVDFQDRTTVVKVPRSFAGSIEAETVSGNIDATGLSGLTACKATTVNGYVQATRLEAGEMSLATTSGSATVNGVRATKVSASSTNGSVVANDVAADDVALSTASGNVGMSGINAKTLVAHTMNGSVVAQDVAADSVSFDTTSGNVTSDNMTAGSLDARTINGSIDMTSLDAALASFGTGSGHVNATFVGSADDYRIDAQSTHGSVHAPQGNANASKQVTASAMNGSITLGFVGGGADGALLPASDEPVAA